jgi:hypothetical protein
VQLFVPLQSVPFFDMSFCLLARVTYVPAKIVYMEAALGILRRAVRISAKVRLNFVQMTNQLLIPCPHGFCRVQVCVCLCMYVCLFSHCRCSYRRTLRRLFPAQFSFSEHFGCSKWQQGMGDAWLE